MLILKAQNVVSEGIPIVYVYQMHQQNGSFAQNVDSEDIPGSTNGVNRKARNNKLDGDRAPPTSTNVLIYKMGWPPRLQFLAPFHISCNPDINKVGNRSYMAFGESSSCTSHLSLTGFDLSGVDPGVMAKQVLKLRVCYLNTAGLTTEQSSAITNAVTDDNSNLYHLKINSGTGSNTRTQLIFAVGNFIREVNIDIWRL